MAPYLFIKNGWIVKQTTAAPVNILAADGRIVKVGPNIEPPSGAKVVDASGLLVLPGLVDAHVHLREPGGEHKEDLTTGTSAALAGGVTTVLGMPNTTPPITDAQSLDTVLTLAKDKAVCDFGFFVGATPENTTSVGQVADAVALKVYMGSSTGSLLVDDFGNQYEHFKSYPHGRPIAVHAENEAAIRWFARQGQRRPSVCAALDTAQALVLAEHLDRHVHICHLSTAQELALVRDAKARGVPVTCEVAPHHLFLDNTSEWKLGPLSKVNPPLRPKSDVKALWQSLEVVDAIASDHAPHTLEEKQIGIADAPAGMPGLETTLPLLLTAAGQGRLMLSDVVRLTSAGPARIFGLRRKGSIAPGYDADLVFVDYEASRTIKTEDLWTKCGWTPFDGKPVRGRIEKVYLRGQLVFSEGQVLAEPGTGQAVEIQPR
jgi:dihydroorotase